MKKNEKGESNGASVFLTFIIHYSLFIIFK